MTWFPESGALTLSQPRSDPAGGLGKSSVKFEAALTSVAAKRDGLARSSFSTPGFFLDRPKFFSRLFGQISCFPNFFNTQVLQSWGYLLIRRMSRGIRHLGFCFII